MSFCMKWFIGIIGLLAIGWFGAVWLVNRNSDTVKLEATDSLQAKAGKIPDSLRAERAATEKKGLLSTGAVNTGNTQPQEVVAFAKTLMGTPYLYGSTDPAKGFDCSGFITYVFNHFGIAVPRSSIEFTSAGREVSAAGAREGDLILFTGTDSTESFVGHMGIVVSNTDTLRFIHSTSGRQRGVTITPLSNYYRGRYVKTVRVFP